MLQGDINTVQFINSDIWEKAYGMKSIKVSKIWTLVDFLKEWKTIVNKLILKIKRKVDNAIERCKTQL